MASANISDFDTFRSKLNHWVESGHISTERGTYIFTHMNSGQVTIEACLQEASIGWIAIPPTFEMIETTVGPADGVQITSQPAVTVGVADGTQSAIVAYDSVNHAATGGVAAGTQVTENITIDPATAVTVGVANGTQGTTQQETVINEPVAAMDVDPVFRGSDPDMLRQMDAHKKEVARKKAAMAKLLLQAKERDIRLAHAAVERETLVPCL